MRRGGERGGEGRRGALRFRWQGHFVLGGSWGVGGCPLSVVRWGIVVVVVVVVVVVLVLSAAVLVLGVCADWWLVRGRG